MDSLEGSSGISILFTSAKYLRRSSIPKLLIEAIVLDFLVASETLNLIHFINGSLTIHLKLIAQNQDNLFDFVLDKFKGLFYLVLFCKFHVECLNISYCLLYGIILLDVSCFFYIFHRLLLKNRLYFSIPHFDFIDC
jgi:hypothetical protein